VRRAGDARKNAENLFQRLPTSRTADIDQVRRQAASIIRMPRGQSYGTSDLIS